MSDREYLKIWFSDIEDANDFFEGNSKHLGEFMVNVYREYAELPTSFSCKLVEKYFKTYLKQINFIKQSKFTGKKGGFQKHENQQITRDTLVGSVVGSVVPPLLPKDKSKKIKDKEENIIMTFEEFWSLYPKKVGRSTCESKFNKLPDSEIQKIKDTIKDWVAFKPFATYNHPNPETYLNQKRWNDEIKKEPVKPNPLAPRPSSNPINPYDAFR